MKSLVSHFASSLASLLSRRLIMAVVALYMLRNAFWGMVAGIYSFQTAGQLTTYQALCIAYFTAVASVVMWYIGNATWKGGLSVAATLQNALTSETRDETITEKIYNLEKLDPKDIPGHDEV